MRYLSSVLVACATLAVLVSAEPQQQTVTMTATATAGQATQTMAAGSGDNAAVGSNANANVNANANPGSGSTSNSAAAAGSANKPQGPAGNSTGNSAGQMNNGPGDSPEGWGPFGDGGWWREGRGHGKGYHPQQARTVSRVFRRENGRQQDNEDQKYPSAGRTSRYARQGSEEDFDVWEEVGNVDGRMSDQRLPFYKSEDVYRAEEKRDPTAGLAPSWHDIRIKQVHQQKRAIPGADDKPWGQGGMDWNQNYGNRDRRNMPGGPGGQGGGDGGSAEQFWGAELNGGYMGKGYHQRRDMPGGWDGWGYGVGEQPQGQQQGGSRFASGGEHKRGMSGGWNFQDGGDGNLQFGQPSTDNGNNHQHRRNMPGEFGQHGDEGGFPSFGQGQPGAGNFQSGSRQQRRDPFGGNGQQGGEGNFPNFGQAQGEISPQSEGPAQGPFGPGGFPNGGDQQKRDPFEGIWSMAGMKTGSYDEDVSMGSKGMQSRHVQDVGGDQEGRDDSSHGAHKRDMPGGDGSWVPSGSGGGDQNQDFSGGFSGDFGGEAGKWTGGSYPARRWMGHNNGGGEMGAGGGFAGGPGHGREQARGINPGMGNDGADMALSGGTKAGGRGRQQHARGDKFDANKDTGSMEEGGMRAD